MLIEQKNWSLGGLNRISDAGFGFSVKFWYCQYFVHAFSLRKMIFGEKLWFWAVKKFVSVIRVNFRCCDATEGALGVPGSYGGYHEIPGGVPCDPRGAPMGSQGSPLDPWALDTHGPFWDHYHLGPRALGVPWGPRVGRWGPLGP